VQGEPVAELGVVIVAHARVDAAIRCIATLPPLPPERIVVVVNAPARVPAEELDRVRGLATVVSPQHEQGYGANLNLGVRALAPVRYLLLGNDDVEYAEGTVEKLVETLAADERVGIVGPAIRQQHGRQPPLQPQFPTRLAIALNMAVLPLGRAWQPLLRRAGTIAPENLEERGRNGWVVGAAMAVRAEAFAEVGGFDEDFFLYYEEVDFCWRVRAAGWRIAWRADAPADHVHAVSTGGTHLLDEFFAGERLYFRKRLGPARLALLDLGLIGITAASWAYNLGAAAVRPRSASARMDTLRERWRLRMFLRRTPARTSPGRSGRQRTRLR
jgi:GT2 family glycosyltransferase